MEKTFFGMMANLKVFPGLRQCSICEDGGLLSRFYEKECYFAPPCGKCDIVHLVCYKSRFERNVPCKCGEAVDLAGVLSRGKNCCSVCFREERATHKTMCCGLFICYSCFSVLKDYENDGVVKVIFKMCLRRVFRRKILEVD